eukprot:3679524-Pyramimonas_sp.AAC.1
MQSEEGDSEGDRGDRHTYLARVCLLLAEVAESSEHIVGQLARPTKPLRSEYASLRRPMKPLLLEHACSRHPMKPIRCHPMKPLRSEYACLCRSTKPLRSEYACSRPPTKPLRSEYACSHRPTKSLRSEYARSRPPTKPLRSEYICSLVQWNRSVWNIGGPAGGAAAGVSAGEGVAARQGASGTVTVAALPGGQCHQARRRCGGRRRPPHAAVIPITTMLCLVDNAVELAAAAEGAVGLLHARPGVAPRSLYEPIRAS